MRNGRGLPPGMLAVAAALAVGVCLTLQAEDRTAAAPAPPNLVIVKAVYGDLKNDKTADVTEKVKSMVTPDGLNITASNDNFGDPVPGVTKQLKVEYAFGDKKLEMTVGEGETLRLARDGAPAPAPAKPETAPGSPPQPEGARPAGKGLRVFHIGNSLTDQAYGMHDIAKGKGYTSVVWGKFTIPGAPIKWCWSHPGNVSVIGANISGDVVSVLKNNPWDALILQLFESNGDNSQTMIEFGGNFAEAAYQGNPNCQVYVFGSYPGRDDNWTTKLPELNKMAVDGAAGISARFPNRKPTLVIPVMQVFDSIRIAITKGQAGSVTQWDNMFLPRPDGHANNNGDYLEAIVHFSTVYKADPHGSIISGLYFWKGLYGVTQSFANVVWDTAWDVIRKYPQSGVAGSASNVPGDAQDLARGNNQSGVAGSAPNAPAMELGGNFWNIGWHKPGDCFVDWQKVQGDNPWNPQFLKDIAIYNSLRFMDWDETNNSPRARWTERNRKGNPRQLPVAYEWMIDLCNRMNADLWVTLPHKTVNRNTGDQPCDYALRLCLLVKTGVDMKEVALQPLLERLAKMTAEELVAAGGQKTCEPLKPNLKLYVEYSNETWNGGFQQSHYCCDEGTALGLDKNRWTAGFRFHAWAAVRLFRAANLVFGADSKRLVRVLATFTANSWIAGQHLEVVKDPKYNPWKVKADAIATAPYFGHDVQGDAPDAVTRMRQAIRRSADDSAKHKKLADAAGLALIAYEGGQHCTRQAAVLNRNPAMYDLYAEYLAEMARYFTVFSHYCHVGQWGDGGAWGAMEFTGQPIEQAHKYRALVKFSKGKRWSPSVVEPTKTVEPGKVDEPAKSEKPASPRDAALRAYGRTLVGHTNAAPSAGGSTTAVPAPAASATTNSSGEP